MQTLPDLVKLLSLDVTTDETHLVLVGTLENGTTIELPMSSEVAMRLLAALQQAHEDFDWPLPSVRLNRTR